MKNNSKNFRTNILSRLRNHPKLKGCNSQKNFFIKNKTFTGAEKIMRLKRIMEQSRTEVHLCSENSWYSKLCSVAKDKKIKKMLFGKNTDLGKKLLKMSQFGSFSLPELVNYELPVEESIDSLFEIDSAITSTRGGIAETGSIIIWPSFEEPRLMSLLPPIHIAVLYANKIHNTFWEVINKEKWHVEMPTNAILISGPSKTADIEQRLVYGVHGCKELVVLLIK